MFTWYIVGRWPATCYLTIWGPSHLCKQTLKLYVNTFSHLLLWIVTSRHHQIFTKVLTNHSVLTSFKIFPLHPSLLGPYDMSASTSREKDPKPECFKTNLKKKDHSIDEVLFSSLQAYLARVKFFLPWYLAHDTLIWFWLLSQSITLWWKSSTWCVRMVQSIWC